MPYVAYYGTMQHSRKQSPLNPVLAGTLLALIHTCLQGEGLEVEAEAKQDQEQEQEQARPSHVQPYMICTQTHDFVLK